MHQGDEEMVMNDDYINLREINEKCLKKERQSKLQVLNGEGILRS